MTEVSQHTTSEGLSASECYILIEISWKAENVFAALRLVQLICLKMKDQTSREKMLTSSGQYFQPLSSTGTTEMSDNHLNYMDKATNPQKTPLHPETDTLLACCQFPPQRDKELMLQAGNGTGYLYLTPDYSWRTGIESCFLLNSKHPNITHRAENPPGSWTLLLLCEDPHAKCSIYLRGQKSEPANNKGHSTKFIGIIYQIFTYIQHHWMEIM